MEEILSPYKIWKQNKHRTDMRKITREFQQLFKTKLEKQCDFIPSNVYGFTYLTDPSIPTDKHNFTPLIVSFGRFKDESMTYVRGLNLFFLRNEQKIELLEDIFKHSNLNLYKKTVENIKLHEKWIRILPWAFKNYDCKRVLTLSEIPCTEWGLVPLLHQNLIGNFNPKALEESFQEENKVKKERKIKTDKKNPILNEEETVSEEVPLTNDEDIIIWDE